MIESEFVVCDSKVLIEKEFNEQYGKGKINILRMVDNTRRFINSDEKAKVIANFDSLANYDTAYFEFGHPDYKQLFTINLSHILTDYEITDNQLIAYKVFRIHGETKIRIYKFPLKNYGKTWRCWTGVPTEVQIRTVRWL